MTFSKVVSGMGGAPSGLLKSGTTIASKSGKDWVSYGGRRAALDPAITFSAPLNRDTQDDLGAADTFTRASDGLYLPYNGADWRIAGTNAPRHEDGKLLMEPAATNVFLNSAAAATQTIILALGDYTLSVHGGGSVTSSDSGGVATGHGTATDGTKVTINVTTAGGILFTVSGSLDYVQVESGKVPTSPIITLGAAGQRAADSLEYVNTFWSDSAGTVILNFTPRWSLDDIEPSSTLRPNFWRQKNGVPGMYWEHTLAGVSRLILRDDIPTFSPGGDMGSHPIAGTSYITASRWSTASTQFEVGVKIGGSWVWPATPGTYGNVWNADTLQLAPAAQLPMLLSQCLVYNEDLGRDGIEARF